MCRPEHEQLDNEQRRIGAIEARFAYAGPWVTAITTLKFAGDLALAGPLGRVLAEANALRSTRWDALVPVPLHPLRLLARGFNQSEVLAQSATRAAATPTFPPRSPPVRRLLARSRATRVQGELPLSDRIPNVKGAFCPTRDVAGMRLLVIDDVTTSGATLQACIDTLRRAGAKRVAGLALLRTLA